MKYLKHEGLNSAIFLRTNNSRRRIGSVGMRVRFLSSTRQATLSLSDQQDKTPAR